VSAPVISVTNFRRQQQDAGDRPGADVEPQVLPADERPGVAPIIVEELLRALGTITRAGGYARSLSSKMRKDSGAGDRVVILERGAIVHDAASHALRPIPPVLERYLGVSGGTTH